MLADINSAAVLKAQASNKTAVYDYISLSSRAKHNLDTFLEEQRKVRPLLEAAKQRLHSCKLNVAKNVGRDRRRLPQSRDTAARTKPWRDRESGPVYQQTPQTEKVTPFDTNLEPLGKHGKLVQFMDRREAAVFQIEPAKCEKC